MNSGIYKLTITRPDGSELFYYGQSQDLRRRESQHSSSLRKGKHDNQRIQRSWEKHGNVRFDVVLLCDMSDLNMFEQRFLDAYTGDPDCMNMSSCAEAAMRGYKHSDESLAKMRAAKTGKKLSPEHRRKIGAAHLGMKRPAGTGRRISEAKRANAPTYQWAHPDHGDLDAPTWVLLDRWPELNHSHLTAVQKGRRNHHKGWTKR